MEKGGKGDEHEVAMVRPKELLDTYVGNSKSGHVSAVVGTCQPAWVREGVRGTKRSDEEVRVLRLLLVRVVAKLVAGQVEDAHDYFSASWVVKEISEQDTVGKRGDELQGKPWESEENDEGSRWGKDRGDEEGVQVDGEEEHVSVGGREG